MLGRLTVSSILHAHRAVSQKTLMEMTTKKMWFSMKPRNGVLVSVPWLARARPFPFPSKSGAFGMVSQILAHGNQTQKLGLAGAGAGVLGLGGLFTYGLTSAASDSSFPTHVRQRLFATYGYMTGGLATTAIAATMFWRSGIALRMAPLPFLLASFAGTLGSLIALRMTPQDQTLLRNLLFGGFTVAQGLSLCPLVILGGPVLMQAAAATAALIGSLTLIAASAPSDAFLQTAGPLSLGLGLVFAASIGSLFFPGSSLLYNIVMYGGLAVFGGFTLYDTQRIVQQAKYQSNYDPLGNSVSIYLNFVNIFVRIASLISDRKRR